MAVGPCDAQCVVTEFMELTSFAEYDALSRRYAATPRIPRSEWFGTCSRACDGGARQIFRFITSQPSLNAPACPDMIRWVTCNNDPCVDVPNPTEDPRPAECIVSSWYELASYADYVAEHAALVAESPLLPEDQVQIGCSAICGLGTQLRYRFVLSYPTSGEGCPALTESTACRVDCNEGSPARIIQGGGNDLQPEIEDSENGSSKTDLLFAILGKN